MAWDSKEKERRPGASFYRERPKRGSDEGSRRRAEHLSFQEAVQDGLVRGFPWRREAWGCFSLLCNMGQEGRTPSTPWCPLCSVQSPRRHRAKTITFFSLSEMHMVDTVTWHKMRGG